MSTAFMKGKLKAAREAIGRKDYQTALDASSQILEYEPDNYNAKVFMGLSLLELDQSERSEQTYRSAIELNPKQALAWQGLSKVYERSQSWDKYAESLFGLAKLFSKSDDATKCAETVQKIVELRRERDRGTRTQLIDALSLYLPDSPFYSTLSSLPPPDPTSPTATTTFSAQSAVQNSLPILEEIVSLLERGEEETIEQEVRIRRTRLNAGGPEEIKQEVGREVYGVSKLPAFYNAILNHPNTSDELRRSTESKLLRHKRQFLQALPSSGEKAEIKKQLMAEVQELVNGMVLLQIPDELAWTIFIDEQDAETLEGYGLSHLRQFVQLFPGAPLTRLIQGYLDYSGISQSEEDDEEVESGQPDENDSDPFDTILDAFSSLQGSIFAHRVLASIYLWDVDYQNAISVAEVGLELVLRLEKVSGKMLPSVEKAFDVILATSLVHLYSPKHHARALRIIDEVLQRDPHNVQCLMGKGFILQSSKDWSRADTVFSCVLEVLPEDNDDAVRAREEHAWCQVQLGNLEEGVELLKVTIDALEGVEGKDEDRARCWWRLGRAYWEMGDCETAYGHFITSLKCSPTFAPAFTTLGVYYLEAADPPDPSRASKCFQKAFELDAREGDAARRLAEGFAEEREWDLVEVVAKRTIEGEGDLEGTVEGSEKVVSGRYLATNAWAWKAVGVVELNRRNYSLAIQAFQVALRAQPEDQLSWLRLGEAYSKAGRHVAAIKTLTRALELQPDDWICSYLIADVQRQTGQFQEAVDSFEVILQKRPEEPGVLMSLAQTHLDLGQSELSGGFVARAEESFVTAIRTSLRFLHSGPGFRTVAWKTISDTVYQLSQSTSFFDEADVRRVLSEVAPLISLDAGSRVSGILGAPLVSSPVTGSGALGLAVASYNYRISLGLLDNAATGSAWFDLGVALNRLSATALDEEQKGKAGKEAISCFKEALGLDPGNDTYWRALGDAHFVSHPKIAQHAYIKALEINNKNVTSWTELGLLYLYHDDVELANEALYKAQTLDPDYTMAWVGQSLVASRHDHYRDSRALLEHAVSLTANAPDADLEFAKREFTRLSEPASSGAPDELFPAFFILSRYVQKRPDDASGLHLLGLVCERLGHTAVSADYLQRAISLLEAAYEETEDPILERRYAVANTSLARARLALRDFAGAQEGFEAALGLLPEPEEGDDVGSALLRAQGHLGLGLAAFGQGRLEEALENLEATLGAAGTDVRLRGQATVLLAQVLWALGTDDTRESAKAQLLECITEDAENLTAISALAGMGILTADDGLVDAALAELLALPPDRRRARDPQRHAAYLLTQHRLAQGDVRGALAQSQRAVHAEPARRAERRKLAGLALQCGQPDVAAAALAGEQGDVGDAREGVRLRAVAEAMRGDEGAGRTAQRAVMLAPWDRRGWDALAFVRSGTG